MSRRRKRVELLLARPPKARFRDVLAVLEDFGWKPRDETKSHVMFFKRGEGILTIPKEHGKWVKRTYLDDICKALDLDVLDLDDLDD